MSSMPAVRKADNLVRAARGPNSPRRVIASLAMALAFIFSATPSFAQATTGTISGTVTAQSGKPLAGVAVAAVAPSQRYATTTQANGFFSITGVSADTYSITFNVSGYQQLSENGVTVNAGQSVTVSPTLASQLQNIGRTQARSGASAFQPTQTTDTYTSGTTQIQTILGKENGNNEALLLASVPGATFDATGFPVLRGGRENEEGFQFEGINYVDPFTNQFVNSLILNGAAQFQVTPGAGNASSGNAGTGTINVVAKRGKLPSFGSLDIEAYAPRSEQTTVLEYGWATPTGRISDYTSFYGDRVGGFQYGAGGQSAQLIGQQNGRANQWANDFLNNFVYKFGKDNAQSVQFFYQNTQFNLHLGNAFVKQPNGSFTLNGAPVYFKNNDPLYLLFTGATSGLSTAQIQALEPFSAGQTSVTQFLGGPGGRYPLGGTQPNETFKLQYSNNISSTLFATAKYYEVNNVELFDNIYNGQNFDNGDSVAQQGGWARGVTLDFTKQLNSRNLVGFGADYRYLHPVFGQITGTGGLWNLFAANGYEVADFLPNNNACPAGPGNCGYLLGNNQGGTAYIAPGTKVPRANESAATNRNDYSLYIQDTYTPTSQLKVDVGLRLDGAHWRYPKCDINTCLPTSEGFFTTGPNKGQPDPSQDQFNYDPQTRDSKVWQPRIAVAYQFTPRDSIRVAYGRSVQFPLIANVDTTNNLAGQLYGAYAGVPSFDVNRYDPALGMPGNPLFAARFCGTTFDRVCTSYADQLTWENAANWAGIPITPLLPTTFNNWEASYSHSFGHQVAMKVTPFYRKAYNAIATAQQPLLKNGQQTLDANGVPLLGPALATNLGHSQITGVEFFVTKEAAYGLSGQLSLTYQNEFSNVIPTSASENFFPSVPFNSLQLGNQYRVGFLSPLAGILALSYRTHSGWRVNPTIAYDHGFPMGAGLVTPFTVNGKPYDLPNTNVTINTQLGGTAGATQYVDPQNPGSVFAPNISATRGTAEGNSAGGVLSRAKVVTQMSLEFTPPRNSHSTYGVLVTNLFNSLYNNTRTLNPRYQPVATGRAAPYSGYTSFATNPAFLESYNYTQRNGNLPYLFQASNIGRTAEFYYQLHL